jgi:hypothetical protein
MIAFLLWFLVTLDAAFTGYREAAGRNALVDKRRYYRQAMIRGALFGQIAVAIAAFVILIMLLVAHSPGLLLDDFKRIGARMLIVYLPYAAIILIAFAIRAIPSVDIRSITSTIVFGPLTLIRPFVALAGIIWGLMAAPRVATTLLGVLVLSLMLGLERVMTWVRKSKRSFSVRVPGY